MSSSDNNRQRRQVLPDVDEGAEYFGHSALGLMQIYFPAFFIWFFAMHFAPEGWGWLGMLFGVVLFILSTIAIFAAPSHESPGAYARAIWTQYTQQGVELHD